MSSSAPLIGVITVHKQIQSLDRSDGVRTFVGAYPTYLRCLASVGALPVLIPLDLPEHTLRGIFEHVDGLLLTGGGDVDPAFYGETAAAAAARRIDRVRDTVEILFSRWAAAEDVPLLGICRGHQVVNVALGGSLYTDIPSQITTPLDHDADHHPLNFHAHEIIIESGSRLAEIVRASRLATNSRHHQAVRETGRGLVVTARTSDGLIEATEKPDARFFLTVQWHPENLCGEDAAMEALFAALVEAAAQFPHNGRSG